MSKTSHFDGSIRVNSLAPCPRRQQVEVNGIIDIYSAARQAIADDDGWRRRSLLLVTLCFGAVAAGRHGAPASPAGG